jgi:hypothetical protein
MNVLALDAAFGGWQPPISTGSELAGCVDGPQMSRASPSGISGSICQLRTASGDSTATLMDGDSDKPRNCSTSGARDTPPPQYVTSRSGALVKNWPRCRRILLLRRWRSRPA